MKPIDINLLTCIDFSKEINDNDHKVKIGDIIRISKYKNIFAVFRIGLRMFLQLKKLKTLCRRNMLLVILKAKKLLEHFTKKI